MSPRWNYNLWLLVLPLPSPSPTSWYFSPNGTLGELQQRRRGRESPSCMSHSFGSACVQRRAGAAWRTVSVGGGPTTGIATSHRPKLDRWRDVYGAPTPLATTVARVVVWWALRLLPCGSFVSWLTVQSLKLHEPLLLCIIAVQKIRKTTRCASIIIIQR